MKVVIDRDKLRKRASLSHAASLGGLLVLLGSVAVSLWKPQWSTVTSIMLVGGFAISVVGIYYANRWVKKPRPEDILDKALSGLNNQFYLYHYCLPCDRLLLTPGGLVVIETCNLEGRFSYKGGKWRQKMTPGRAMRFFVEEQLGNPIARAQACAHLIQDSLTKDLQDNKAIPVHAVVVFTNPNSEIHVESAPIPVCQSNKLREKLPKGSTKLPMETYDRLRERINQIAGFALEEPIK